MKKRKKVEVILESTEEYAATLSTSLLCTDISLIMPVPFFLARSSTSEKQTI